MRHLTLSLVLLSSLSCGDNEPLTLVYANEAETCAEADYSVCGTPLTDVQYNGEPWPTFSEALAEACIDGTSSESGWQSLRGVCADGKQFISKNGGFGGDTRYFEGEVLVGGVSSTDFGVGPCECPFQRFQGTLETVRCDSPMFEALCASRLPMEFAAPFSQGAAGCLCDEEGY